MRARAVASACAFALAFVAFVAPASAATAANAAAMQPARAQSDVDAAMRERGFAFCRDPGKPLSPAARALCPHAASLPDCAGFAEACAPEPPERESSFLRNLLRALASMIPDFVKSVFLALARLPAVLFLVLVAAIVVAGLLAAGRSMRGRRRDAVLRERGERPATPEEELAAVVETTDAEALLGLADGHARDGKNDLALQLYLAASLRALDRRGVVQWAKNRTNGEYVRACSDEPARAPLRELVLENDRVQFGRVPATSGVVARAASLAGGIVRWLPVAALVLASPGMLGCGGWKDRRVGNDPAGNDLFYEVLRRQGVHVDGLDGPLGALPIEPGQPGPAVVVDVTTTPLDDDTRSHLVDWVRAGGVLVVVGDPDAWPPAFRAKTKSTTSGAVSAWARADAQTQTQTQTQTGVPFRAQLADPSAFELGLLAEPEGANEATDDEPDSEDDERPEALDPVASFDDGSTYAAAWPSGRGLVLGVASDELTTNAGLARPGNAAVLVAILSHANRAAFAIAEPEDGAASPSSPLAALRRAGLGLALGQGLAAILVLFAAAGLRLAAPKPPPLPRRRAFVEHVEAVGALYARTGAAGHALASYARFAEQRLRARMPRGAVDVAAYLASRSHLPLDVCERLLRRASDAGDPGAENRPGADDLMILKELSAAYAAATAHDP
jgi:hypothetical protein